MSAGVLRNWVCGPGCGPMMVCEGLLSTSSIVGQLENRHRRSRRRQVLAILSGVLVLVPVGEGVARFLGHLLEQLRGERHVAALFGESGHAVKAAKPNGLVSAGDIVEVLEKGGACLVEQRLQLFG